MAKGTRIHKVLEEEVHTTVPVEVTTREDAFGLKLFNMCQGLDSLSEQGMTRELSVFGYLDGVFVQGIIDEITYLDPAQSHHHPHLDSKTQEWPPRSRTAFITDTKTRATSRLPTGSQLRSTALQLMFYHRLLTLLPDVPFAAVLAHHGLDGAAPFSDRFIAQIAAVASGISLPELLENNSLHGLWVIVLRHLGTAVSEVGATVGVVFRAQSNGGVMARRAWGVDAAALESHLGTTMEWWRGERPSVGVEIEDAWKCRSCDFEESCVWRLKQIEKLADGVRAKKAAARATSKARSKKKKMRGTGESDTEEGRRISGSGSEGSVGSRKRRAKVGKLDMDEGIRISESASEGSVKLRKKKAKMERSGESDINDGRRISGSASEGSVKLRKKKAKTENPKEPGLKKGEGRSESDGERKAKGKVRARRKPKQAGEPAN